MAANGIHISLAAEPIYHIGDFAITNSMFTSVIVSAILISFALVVNRNLKHTQKPTGLQNFAEWIVESLYNFVYSVTGDLKKASIFFPLIGTFFLFILLNNWLGLLPGVGTIVSLEKEADEEKQVEAVAESESVVIAETDEAHSEEAPTAPEAPVAVTEEESHEAEVKKIPLLRPGTADLNTTIALGLISIIAVQAFGFQFHQFGYFKKYFNFSSPIMFYVGILELVSELSKIISFAFRLFGNIFAGEVLLVVITALTGLVAPIPFYGLEVFVGFIQALVFSMLSLVMFNMATLGHGEDEH